MIISHLLNLNIFNSITRVTTEHCGTRNFDWSGNSPGVGACSEHRANRASPHHRKTLMKLYFNASVSIRATDEEFLKFVPFFPTEICPIARAEGERGKISIFDETTKFSIENRRILMKIISFLFISYVFFRSFPCFVLVDHT